ncbi:MAG: outer membrane lipoprotein carrier protein LolA [Deltaproteobacteria bacterium]|nr:outer membrane lipoprotein carrier protein LolA [Deltaproteobacteria bacterium]
MKKTLLILVAMFLPHGTFGNALPAENATDSKKALIFSRISRATSGVKTLASDFLEEKHVAMLQEPVFSRGRFYFENPDRLRWERIEPTPSGFAIQGNKAKRWRGQHGEPKVFELHEAPGIKSFADQVFAWVRADFEWLERGYRIRVVQEDPVVLKLVPLSSSEKNYLNHLRIVFASDLSHVRIVEIHERDGDFTRLRFMNIVVNGPRPKDLF